MFDEVRDPSTKISHVPEMHQAGPDDDEVGTDTVIVSMLHDPRRRRGPLPRTEVFETHRR